ncbi:MAG TPA: FlgD immunoglobulin-like domain containing protein [Calditrichia bacterium]|nr:FlgD immunoglobulin-like domain containing protein [Calditrichia bacterium]HQV31112.1 FlgD immunoglobulin-like domain containing protein [Calditrichia bacterium]
MSRFIRSLTVLVFTLLLFPAVLPAQQYDLRFVVTQNEGFVGGTLRLTLQVRAIGSHFAMGTGNLVFDFNPAGLQSPSLVTAHNFSGGPYHPLSLTEPSAGRASLNIELVAPDSGASVSDDFVDVATVAMVIDNPTLPLNLLWRNSRPNRTVVFDDDLLTEISPANPEGDGEKLEVGVVLPAEFSLAPNYPNPFNPETHIRYQLPQTAGIRLTIFNALGQQVRILAEGVQAAGVKTVRWDGQDGSGRPVASGVYFYRLEIETFDAMVTPGARFSQTRKMLLVR